MYNCNICNKEFSSSKSLNGHKYVHREGGRYSYRKKRSANICLACGKLTYNAKYCNNICQGNHKRKIEFDKLQRGEIVSEGTIKRFIFSFRGRKCEECGIGEEWNNRPLTLQVDHIDGNSDNNSIDNLKILCPNCHTQTHTWCGRNKKNTKRNKYQRFYRAEKKRILNSAGECIFYTDEAVGSNPTGSTILVR